MMFEKFLKKKETVQDIAIYAPVSGELISLEDVPDPVFSKKMMGDGVAIKPENGEVVAPVEGKIIQLFPTMHAIGMLAANGAEILIHIGLDTVNLEGEGFTSYIQEGDKVNRGDKLISFNRQHVIDNSLSTITPIIITNTDDMSEIKAYDKKDVVAGEDEILFVKK